MSREGVGVEEVDGIKLLYNIPVGVGNIRIWATFFTTSQARDYKCRRIQNIAHDMAERAAMAHDSSLFTSLFSLTRLDCL